MSSFAKISIRFNADLKQFSSELQNAQRKMSKVGKQMQRVGSGLTLGVTLPILGIGAASIKAASDAQETASKFNTVFRDISKAANASADELRNAYGLSSTASQQLLSDTGDLLTGFGFSQQSALDLSTEVNKLAVDLASFTNFSGGAEGASQALTKALLGERESVKSLGISILEADVKAKVLENTQKGVTFESERQAKAFATLELAQEQSKNAIGDYARTNKSFANQMRLVKARVEDVAVQFGEILLPYVTKLAGKIGDLVDYFAKLDPAVKKTIVVVAGLAAALGPVLVALGFMMTTVIPGLVTAFGVLSTAMAATPWGAIAIAVGVAAAALIAYNSTAEKVVKTKASLRSITAEATKAIAAEKAEVEKLLFIARDENVSKEQRLKAVKELNKISPKYLGNLKLETINTDKAREAIDKYNDALLRTAKAKAAQEKLQEIQAKIIDKELELSARRKKIIDEQADAFGGAADNAAAAAESEKRLALAKKLVTIETENGTAALKEQEKQLLEIIRLNGLAGSTGGTPTGNTGGTPGQSRNLNGSESIGSSQTFSGNLLQGVADLMPAYADRMSEAQIRMKETQLEMLANAQEFNEKFTEITANTAANFAVGFGELLGNFANGGLSLKNIANLVLSTLADMAIQVGQMAIGIGFAVEGIKTALQSLAGPVAIAAGIALVALGTFAKSALSSASSGSYEQPRAFADGGIVYGPTRAIFGEYAGARTNPEVVAPLDKLKSMIADVAGGGNVRVHGEFKIRNRELVAQVDSGRRSQSRRT